MFGQMGSDKPAEYAGVVAATPSFVIIRARINPAVDPDSEAAHGPEHGAKDHSVIGGPERPRSLLHAVHRQSRLQAAAADRAPRTCFTTPRGRRFSTARPGWCTNAGHNRGPIVEAIQKQAAELDFAPTFQFGHPRAFELASRIAALAPADLDHVFFCNSGSEAADTAMKIALAYWVAKGQGQRTRFIGRERGYHGVGFGGMAVGGLANNRKAFGAMLPGVDHLPHTYNREQQAYSKGEPEWGAHLADELERIVALHGDTTIAAVIVEPMAGSTAVLPAPKGHSAAPRDLRQIPHPADLMRSSPASAGLATPSSSATRRPRHDHLCQGVTSGSR
jgi:adenosylmethionine-8-amino-7-oxononanoate aminotransferase